VLIFTSNLSGDINLAARNALAAMIDYIVSEYGYGRTQAYMIASIAGDLRILSSCLATGAPGRFARM
jgi:acetamidase/formamidase